MNGIEHDSTLREAFQARTGGPPPGTACPDPGRIYDAARGALPPAEIREVVEHLALCPECAEAWRLATAFEEEAADAAAEPAPATTRAPWRPRWVAAAAALATAALAVGVWWTVVEVPQEAPIYRAAGEMEIRSLLPEGVPLSREEPVLSWQMEPEPPEGTTYDLLVSTEALEPVAEASELQEPRYELPGEALAGLPSGARLLWQIEATTPEGRRIASPTFLIELK